MKLKDFIEAMQKAGYTSVVDVETLDKKCSIVASPASLRDEKTKNWPALLIIRKNKIPHEDIREFGHDLVMRGMQLDDAAKPAAKEESAAR